MYQYDFMAIGLCGQSVFLSVPHFHAPEETLHAVTMVTEPGGKAYNQAVAGTRLGGSVCFAGAVGEDEEARICGSVLKEAGVNRAILVKKPGERTAYACILTDQNGANRVTVYPGASRLLCAADIRSMSAAIRDSAILLLTCELSEEAFQQAVEIADRSGVKVLLNPAPYQPWVKDYLTKVWCVTPNADEARRLFGWERGDLTISRPLPDSLTVVITNGADGACLGAGGELIHFPAPRVHAADTTGAGDAFNAALALCTARGASISDAVKAAIASASQSVQFPHVIESYRHLMPLY